MIWLLFAVMAFVVVAALLWPLLRNPPVPADRVAYDMTVFRDQLQEVDRDVNRGVVTADEAEAARIEIKRRMLTTSKRDDAPARAETPQTRALLTAGLAVAVPFVALGLYMTVGTPLQPASHATQAAAGAAEHGDADMQAMVQKLAARMRDNPDDPQGWSLLARSYRQMERYGDAAEAYRNMMRLAPNDPEGFAGFAEVTIAAGNGAVTPEAHDALVRTLKLDPTEPRAQFYIGLELAEDGDAKGAIAVWRALTASAPKDAPWLDMVRGQMAQVAQEAGVMPMSVQPRSAQEIISAEGQAPVAKAMPASPAPPPAPAQSAADPATPDVSALKDRFSGENLNMIQGMVGGLVAKLENDPSDYNGWLLLGRSYTVLKNIPGAEGAYLHAVALKPTEPAPSLQLTELLVQDRSTPTPMLVKLAEDTRKADARQPLALFILGAAKAGAGDASNARKLWDDAAQSLPANSPLKAEIARRQATLH